jgi:fatty acid desaturase
MPGGMARRRLEWPTLLLLAGIYVAFGLLTWNATALPWWTVLPLGAFLVCLHGSAQHEALHGHPTRRPWLNELLVFPALGLWFPYRRYARLHRIHHHNESLTDPLEDPESWYMLPERWAELPPLLQALYRLNNTLTGRLLIGPAVAFTRFVGSEIRDIRNGDRMVIEAWAVHLPAALLVLWWVCVVCQLPLWQYVLLFVYPGTSLTLLRSFCEHRAHETADGRTIIVEAGPLLSLLYLNNNLHAAHHEAPGLAWYELPAYYRARRGELLARNGGYLARGYAELIRRYAFSAKESVPHPLPPAAGNTHSRRSFV